jgi:hypothetical protein
MNLFVILPFLVSSILYYFFCIFVELIKLINQIFFKMDTKRTEEQSRAGETKDRRDKVI